MKVKIIRSTFVNGELAQVGDSVEVTEVEAKQLIAAKKAVAIGDGKVEKATAKPQKD